MLEILRVDESLITTHLNDLKAYAMEHTYVPLASFLIVKRPEEAEGFSDLFAPLQGNADLWRIPDFPRAFCLVWEKCRGWLEVRRDLLIVCEVVSNDTFF
jgi:hypothetical protein